MEIQALAPIRRPAQRASPWIWTVLLIVMPFACAFQPTEGIMAEATLTCEVKLSAQPGGEVGLVFEFRNPSSQLVRVDYYQPFVDFDLSVQADDGAVPVVQPGYDTGVRPVTLELGKGQTARVETPIRLRFDPTVAPSGGDRPTSWSLRHAPAPVTLRFTPRLTGVNIPPCETRWDPARLR